jgi:hypothetical protein
MDISPFACFKSELTSEIINHLDKWQEPLDGLSDLSMASADQHRYRKYKDIHNLGRTVIDIDINCGSVP